MKNSLGYRFHPRDYELLMILFDFVTGKGSHDARMIRREDLYGEKEPWEIFRRDSHEKFQYFFTELKRRSKKNINGSRFERTVGKTVNNKRPGHWHGHIIAQPVFDRKRRAPVGYKRGFLYRNKEEPEQDRQWRLEEYYLSPELIEKAMEKYPVLGERRDFVLCRIQRKKRDHQECQFCLEDVPIETILQILEGETSEEQDNSKSLS